MKQAYGGAFMMILFMIILIVVVAFASIGLVIGKAYRTKNQIITYIENYQGCEEDSLPKCKLRGDQVSDRIKKYVASNGYKESDYSVEREKATSLNCKNCYYYEVTISAGWYLPFISNENKGIIGASSSKGMSGTFAIRGKTDLIRE